MVDGDGSPRRYVVTMFSTGEMRMVERLWTVTFVVRPSIEILSVVFEDRKRGLRFLERSSTKSELYNRLVGLLVKRRPVQMWDMEPRQFDKEDQESIDAMRLAYVI